MPLSLAAGTVIGAGIGALGSAFSGKQSADFAKESYKHRYQWQVKDLQKAGLNPMLAVQQGAPNVAQPQFQNIGEGAVKGAGVGSAVGMAAAQKANLQADTDLKGTASAVNIATARESSIRAGIAESQLPWAPMLAQATAVGADKQIAYLQTQIQNVAEQTRGHKLNNDQLEKIQPILLEIEKLKRDGMAADVIKKEVYGRIWSIVPSQSFIDKLIDVPNWPKNIRNWSKKHGYAGRE